MPTTAKSRCLRDVQILLDYIYAGDCYQVNYSQAFTAHFTGENFAAYCALRKSYPGAFITTTQGAILSLSPGQFIHIKGWGAHSRPIKITAARGSAPRQKQMLPASCNTALKTALKI